jgi:hypothetical protein
MPSPAARAFDDFGPLILGNDALDLDQQFVFGSLLDLPIEKHHAHADPAGLAMLCGYGLW